MTPAAISDYVRTTIDRSQGRSMVFSSRGVATSEHPLASQAGAAVLARGGHAVDAALAMNAAMGVLAPMANGLGGDLFAIVYDHTTGEIHGVNGSGWSPAALTPQRLRAAGTTTMPQSGIESVTVPGVVAAWDTMHARFGRTPLAEVLAPAIAIAQEGFPVPELTAAEWQGSDAHLRRDPESARVYLPGGRAPHVGELFRNPDLANTLRRLVRDGLDSFYAGAIAASIVEASRRRHGALAAADLAEYDAEWTTPLSTTYRGWTVYEMPPNGQGIAALLMLNLLEQSPIAAYGHNSVEALHVLIEAKKLAYADMARHVADPAHYQAPLEALLSKDYAADRARLIDPGRANPEVTSGLPSRGSDTTYLTVVDRDGNMVSLIQSNFANFGSGVVPEGTGFALQSRGGLFTLEASHPNVLAPRKRPLHTILPGLMTDGDTRITFGIMGGWNQSQAHAQFISNVVDHGMNIQAAMEAPRVTKLTFAGNDVLAESRIPAAVRQGLAAKGHEVEALGSFSNMVGGGQAVLRTASTRVAGGASDPRKDGAAIPEPFSS